MILRLAWAFFIGNIRSSQASTIRFSIYGFIIGFISLVVAMAVVSGFESSLYQSVIQVNSHLQIRKSINTQEEYNEIKDRMQLLAPAIKGVSPTLWVEALAISQGTSQGIIIQGLEPQTFREVIQIEKALLTPVTSTSLESGKIWVGSGIAKKWGLNIGQKLSIVVPLVDDANPNKLNRKHRIYEVGGILSLGKFEYDERLVIMDLAQLQDLAQISHFIGGIMVLGPSADWALENKAIFQQKLGPTFRLQSWYDVNSYLFEAIKIEKLVIFFVIFLIIIASGFNAAVSLWIGILQKTRQIAVLKTLGMQPQHILYMLSMQGFILVFIGAFIGIPMAIGLCYLIDWSQNYIELLPGSVYRLSQFQTQIRMGDLGLIFGSALVLSWVAVLWPARSAANKSIAEGLRYE